MNTNKVIANIFSEIADILEIRDDNKFKIRAYRNASRTISRLNEDITELSESNSLTNVKGVGKDLAQKIDEYLNTGNIGYYEELKSKLPPGVTEMLKIQGVGPKFVSKMYNEYDINSIQELSELLDSGKAEDIKGIGKRKISELRENISHFIQSVGNINIGIALPIAELVVNEIIRIAPGSDPQITGSVRRMKETVRNIDILCLGSDNADILQELSKSDVITDTISIDNREGYFKTYYKDIQVNVRLVEKSARASSMIYYTGSREYNSYIGKAADRAGYRFNKNGLFKDNKEVRAENEEEIFSLLGTGYLIPELRESDDEQFLRKAYSISEPVYTADIKGDLHTHSTWSDGSDPVGDMVDTAIEMGYEYIAVTDHSPSSTIANGLSAERLMQKLNEIEEIDNRTEGIKVFMGAEVDIKKDGTLDYPDEVLSRLDIVVASVHSNFRMDSADMTQRIVKALQNPYVHILGHPTGRLIGERKPYDLDMERIMDTVLEQGKILEINSSWKRLDLGEEYARAAVRKGIMLAISTDAHSTGQLGNIRYGAAIARRGFVNRKDILNTMTLTELQDWLNSFTQNRT